ncbi:MAG: hypothetical protein M0P09_05720 [Acholeplasmataceae bacterium]|nr:hypothetical protein [Acholeplasmataceae bacterium]
MRSITNDSYLERKQKYFPNVSDADWDSWHWQVRNRLQTTQDLEKFITLNDDEKKSIEAVLAKFRMAITPYYFSLIDLNNPDCPI